VRKRVQIKTMTVRGVAEGGGGVTIHTWWPVVAADIPTRTAWTTASQDHVGIRGGG